MMDEIEAKITQIWANKKYILIFDSLNFLI